MNCEYAHVFPPPPGITEGLTKNIGILLLSVFLGIFAAAPAWADKTDFSSKVKKPVNEAIDICKATQEAKEKWMIEKQKLTAVYDQLQEERHRLQLQEDELLQEVAAVRERVAAKEKQLADVAQISEQINPYLNELVDRLRKRFEDDIPFLTDERRRRVEKLEALMEDPRISVNEKFRKVMEAYLIEAEYGNTIEVYQETISIGGQPMLVNVFRLGRISLFYQTQDKKVCGCYDMAEKIWKPLPKSYNLDIQTVIEIGERRRPVELLSMPIGRIVVR